MAKSSLILELPQLAPSIDIPAEPRPLGVRNSAAFFVFVAALIVAVHLPLLRLPYFWDEAGYYIPAARDLLAGSLIPHSTPSNAHPPLVLAYLALTWKLFGQSQVVTRCAMLLIAAFSLLGFFRLARTVSGFTVATAATVLVALYPVFFAQSSLAQIDLPAAGLTFWALEAYFRRRTTPMIVWFALAGLAKETAILAPLALFSWELVLRLGSEGGLAFERFRVPIAKPRVAWLLVSVVPLAVWYAYHYSRTGVIFGNPEFFRYNVRDTLHILRVVLAIFVRIWHLTGYLGLYVLSLACFIAMQYPPIGNSESHKPTRDDETAERPGPASVRPRIAVQVQLSFLAITIAYVIALSVVGGAALARYMLPVVPLWILVCVSTIWRRLAIWKPVLVIVGLAFVGSIFVNPPYGFSFEDNLAYRDYVRLHQRAEAFLESHYPAARVLTAWPATDELSRPYLGYVPHPMSVLKIEDFTAEQLLSAADARSNFHVALVFSTKYQPANSLFDRWRFWREWKSQYFGYHIDLGPEAAASVLGGKLVYTERFRGQWIALITIEKIEDATLLPEARMPRPLVREF